MSCEAAKVSVMLQMGDDSIRVEVSPGTSLKQIFDGAAYPLPSECGGKGRCGCCRVRVPSESLSPPGELEETWLGPDLLAHGWRLACQARVCADLEVSLAPLKSRWRKLGSDESLHGIGMALPASAKGRHAIAVDLGTTHIRVSVADRVSGHRLGARVGLNPQARFGSDVLSRLSAAAEPAVAEMQSRLVVEAIGDAIAEIVQQDLVQPLKANCLTLVGNTAMLALLTQTEATRLLEPDNWLSSLACSPPDPQIWKSQWRLDQGSALNILQPVAGFVGSDLLADLLACGLKDRSAPCLVIDVGTNTELALWDGERAWITATPGGPAFEGVGISCGIPSGDGAVYRILDDTATGRFHFLAMGEGKPVGLCGPALVDLVALLLGKGILMASGRFAQPIGPRGYPLEDLLGERFLKSADVDALQRGKGPIAAAASCLLALAGMVWSDLKTLHLCGAFGHHLSVPHAQAIGLLPVLPDLAVELVGGASLLGCERAMLDEDCQAFLESVRSTARLINLAMQPEFDNCFIANLRLRPMNVGEAATC
jgi:uncharacterized 2Fe-2S/4Fe-4S cluster protein (DUF4445 family)